MQDQQFRNLQSEKFSSDDENEDDGVPSAPPFSGSVHEIRQGTDQIPISGVRNTTVIQDSQSIATKVNVNTQKPTPDVKVEDNAGNRNSGQFVRYIYFVDSMWQKLHSNSIKLQDLLFCVPNCLFRLNDWEFFKLIASIFCIRTSTGAEAGASSGSHPARIPTFHARYLRLARNCRCFL